MMDFKTRFERSIRFLQNRLSPEGYAGLHLTIGVLVVLLAGFCFGEIAEDVSRRDPMVLLDQQVALWFNQHATPPITHIAKAISFLGSIAWLTAVSAGLAVVFIWRRTWFRSLVLALTMVGGSALVIVLKHFFHRQRPVLENPLVTLSS